jgi:hypothetical protein
VSTLQELFTKYGTDKAVNGYAKMYENLLMPSRIYNLLEIGIGTMNIDAEWSMQGWALDGYKPGGSLRAWRDWMPCAVIVGMDLESDTQFSEPGIRTVQGNSQRCGDVTAALGSNRFDVIIDDADHSPIGQVTTYWNLRNNLESGAWYIIEDCRDLVRSTERDKLPPHIVLPGRFNNMRNDMIALRSQ